MYSSNSPGANFEQIYFCFAKDGENTYLKQSRNDKKDEGLWVKLQFGGPKKKKF